MQVLLGTPAAWHLRQTAKAFAQKNALAGLWISDKNSTNIPPERFRRCWPYHLAMKPFYHCAPQIWTEKAFYALSGIWRQWLRWQFKRPYPQFDVAHAIMGFATEFFVEAEKNGALKVIDCANSHPTTLFGFWQRECDLWYPGEKVPIPRRTFARMNRELERADLIIVQSKFCKETMVLNGIPGEKVMINPLGVDTSIFKKRAAVPEKTRFISVGTICLRKGHQYLFRAFETVKKILPDAELICVGDYKSDFRLERPKWEKSFIHYADLTHSQVAELLQSATAFVFPSQEEGIARAQIEALASGLPVIGTHEGGATTLIQDGIEGFIVRGRDPQHIADAMIKITQPDLNRRMGDAAYKKGAEQNTWQDYGDRLLAEYEKRMSLRSKQS
jgi:glycosyltransferase involved in cell wall biosynthesis